MGFFLGIDGGGTKTECVLADEAGETLARATGGGSNLRRISREELRDTLVDCFDGLWRQTLLTAPRLEVVCAGFAGVSDAQARAMAREVLAEVLRPRFLYVVGDMEVALEAAVGVGPGVVLIAGTGSIAYGRNERGQQARAGGLGLRVAPDGKVVADEGSGLAIGLRAAEMVWGLGGSGQRPTLLAERLSAVLQAGEEKERGCTMGVDLAQAVPLVVEAARAGDAAAQEILAEAATALAALAVDVLRQLGLLGAEVVVAVSGGVFAESEDVYARVQEEIRRTAPQARVERLHVSPAEGAVRLAQRLWLAEQSRG
ncbi:MAG: hypothetical protein HYY26_04930 [Acidobacteria bacterium]|nr:hypothetical protein [Acidobacteriota bacterium]